MRHRLGLARGRKRSRARGALERILQAKLPCVLAQRRNHFLRNQPHARAPRLGRYWPVVLPKREDAWPQYIKDVLEPRDNRLGRADDQLARLLGAFVAGVTGLTQRLNVDLAFERLEQRGAVGVIWIAELPGHPPRGFL